MSWSSSLARACVSPQAAGMEQWPTYIPSRDQSDIYYEFRREVQLVVEISAWLRHRNLHGEEGARKVEVVRLAPYGSDFEILAHEGPNRLFRTFLASRVLEFVDLNTGERVDDVVAYLTEVHRRSSRGQVFLAIRKLAVEMGVLVTLARASGQMRAKQRGPILEYARRAAAEFQIDADRFANYVAMASLSLPLAEALGQIASKGREHAADVLGAAETVAATRTGERAATDRILSAVRKHLSR